MKSIIPERRALIEAYFKHLADDSQEHQIEADKLASVLDALYPEWRNNGIRAGDHVLWNNSINRVFLVTHVTWDGRISLRENGHGRRCVITSLNYNQLVRIPLEQVPGVMGAITYLRRMRQDYFDGKVGEHHPFAPLLKNPETRAMPKCPCEKCGKNTNYAVVTTLDRIAMWCGCD